MKKQALIVTTFAFLMTLAAAPTALAQQGRGYNCPSGDCPHSRMGRMGRGMRGKGMWRELMRLDLTEEQKTKAKEIRDAHREKMGEKMKAKRDAREALQKAVKGDASNDELRKLHSDLAGIRAVCAGERFEMALSIRSILTPEQRKKFRLMKPMRGRGKGMPLDN